VIATPPVLNLDSEIDTTLSFLNNITEVVSEKGMRVRLDLTDLEVLTNDAALCLASSFVALQQATGNRKTVTTESYPNLRRVELHLQQCGFFETLGLRSRLPGPAKPDQYLWFPPQSGKSTDGATVDLLQKRLFGFDTQLDSDLSTNIYRAVTEAMANVVEHAYATIQANSILSWLNGRWWMSGYLDSESGIARIFLRDLGVGVPKSLSAKLPSDTLNRIITWTQGDGYRDVDLLRAAMIVGKSGTRLPFRGKGMQDMLRLAKRQPGGRFRVISGYGNVEIDDEGVETSTTLKHPMVGTFVEWSLPLN
jgi:hypothetical protein